MQEVYCLICKGYLYQFWAGLGSMLGLLFGTWSQSSFALLIGLFFGGMTLADLLMDFVQTFFVAPLWSAHNEAWARKYWAWILTIFRRSLYWSLL